LIQSYELCSKREFQLQNADSITQLENFIKHQLFCDEATPCSVLMSESYKQFRMACCRVIGAAGMQPCEVYLDNNWKLELTGDTVYVLRLESKIMPGVNEMEYTTGIRKRAALEDNCMHGENDMHGMQP